MANSVPVFPGRQSRTPSPRPGSISATAEPGRAGDIQIGPGYNLPVCGPRRLTPLTPTACRTGGPMYFSRSLAGRRPRRASVRLRLEVLEARTLLNNRFVVPLGVPRDNVTN